MNIYYTNVCCDNCLGKKYIKLAGKFHCLDCLIKNDMIREEDTQQVDYWRECLWELFNVYTLLSYARTPESLEEDFPKEKVYAMLAVYEDLSGVSRVTIAQEALDSLKIKGQAFIKDGDVFVQRYE